MLDGKPPKLIRRTSKNACSVAVQIKRVQQLQRKVQRVPWYTRRSYNLLWEHTGRKENSNLWALWRLHRGASWRASRALTSWNEWRSHGQWELCEEIDRGEIQSTEEHRSMFPVLSLIHYQSCVSLLKQNQWKSCYGMFFEFALKKSISVNNAAGNTLKGWLEYHATCELVCPILRAQQMAVKHLFPPWYHMPYKC